MVQLHLSQFTDQVGMLTSQVAFAESSICYRIAFAPPCGRNRTADVGYREEGGKPCLRSQAGRFLRSCLKAKSEELRLFPAIFRATQPNFSAVQTAWRRERDSNPRYPFGYSGFQVHRRLLIGWENSLLYLISQQLTNLSRCSVLIRFAQFWS